MSRPNLLKGEDLLSEPSQQRSRLKRARIEAAGLALFGQKGYERTSIDEIAAEAKLATGGVYRHFRSKRQLLLVLMDQLLEDLSQLDLRPRGGSNIREGLRTFLGRALATDIRYAGAYRAWREAVVTDASLAGKETEIRAWSTGRVRMAFSLLQQLPGARAGIDVEALAQVMDEFFWSLLGQAASLSETAMAQWVEASTHLIFHALFQDHCEA
jgi:AcrR family transcriptional regulator